MFDAGIRYPGAPRQVRFFQRAHAGERPDRGVVDILAVCQLEDPQVPERGEVSQPLRIDGDVAAQVDLLHRVPENLEEGGKGGGERRGGGARGPQGHGSELLRCPWR